MMASVEIAELSKRLSCAICLDTLLDPKTLNCGHNYCKCCLDNLVAFASNGSAFIKCPQGCAQVTKLTAKQTTDDLVTNYTLKDILEMTVAQKKDAEVGNSEEFPTCHVCGEEPQLYVNCKKMFMCNTCYLDSGVMSKVTQVKFRAQRKELLIMCSEHRSCVATYVCCSEYLCIYCVKRTAHKSHGPEKLDEVKSSLKTVIRNGLSGAPFWFRLQVSKKERRRVKQEAGKVLLVNKLRCLIDYLEVLEKEESSLTKHLDALLTKHMKDADPLYYLEECLLEEDTQFMLQREDILLLFNNIKNGSQEPSPSCMLSLSLTDPKYDGADHHLGVLASDSTTENSSAGSTSDNFDDLTDKKLFANGITTDINPAQSWKSIRYKMDDELSRFPGYPNITSVGKAIRIDGTPRGVYLAMTVRRFSKRSRLNTFNDGVEVGKFLWTMALKGLWSDEKDELSMFINCGPVPSVISFDATVVVRNEQKIYSMLHFQEYSSNKGIVAYFLNTSKWDERRGEGGPFDTDYVMFEAFIRFVAPVLQPDGEVDKSSNVGEKRMRR